MNIANQVKRAPLPDGLRHLAGQLMDVDSHEMMPAQVWVRECGPIAERLAHDWLSNGTDVSTNINNPNVRATTAMTRRSMPTRFGRKKDR